MDYRIANDNAPIHNLKARTSKTRPCRNRLIILNQAPFNRRKAKPSRRLRPFGGGGAMTLANDGQAPEGEDTLRKAPGDST